MSSKMMVFTGNANPELAQKVASRLYLSLGKADVGKFSDGEVAVELNEHFRQVFELTKLNEAIHIYSTEQEALKEEHLLD